VENYYQSAGIEKYFLSDIPPWANFSERGQCNRNYTTRFLDIESVMKSFSINFADAISLQATFNDEYNRINGQYKERNIPLSDEQNLFFKASEKVNSKIKFFDTPKFNRIHLIWIDSLLKSLDEEKKLKAFLNSPVNNEGVPVLVSMCLTKKEIEEKFPNINYKSISSEMLSIYNPDGSKSPIFKFYFDQFFTKDQKIFFYSREKIQNINEFNGVFKFINF
jgi:hypothetical protein